MMRHLCLILVFVSLVSRAEVVRVEIAGRSSFADGKSFGLAGAYERIKGRMFIETDPANKANIRISDLKRAPRNARGKVESWTDFFLLKPVDAKKGNGQLLYDVNNRGNMLALWTFNDGERTNDPRTEAHAGHGFLMKHGFSVLWCGWNGEVQADETQRLLCGLPIATENGKTITGRAHLEITSTEKVFSRAFSWSPWGIGAAFPSLSLDNADATLTMRPHRGAEGVEVPRGEWTFGRWENETLIPDAKHVYVKAGLRPGWLYDLVYTAKEPRVTGFGLTAMRDCVAYFRHGDAKMNPLAGAIEKASVFGISQSGRVIHHFLFEGLNSDEQGRIVFDGALIHVAGSGKGMFNHRFRMSTEYGTQHEGHLSGSEFFPLAPLPQTDPVTGESDDSLARSRKSGHTPRILFTQTSTEYWSRAASLLHTDVEGKADLTLPDDVRVYLVAGAQHLGKSDGTPGICQQPRNTLDDRGPVLRAMLLNLSDWVQNGKAPPPSRHPRLADQSLVSFDTWKTQFPKMPGHNMPTHAYQPPRLDFGSRFHSEGIADIIPPKVGKPFQTLLPAVNADGNETCGIVLPEVAAPLGTYTGWNLRSPQVGAETMLSPLDGMFVPFAKTKAEREKTGDPRLSLEERYPTRADYLSRLTEAAKKLQAEGFLLEEDVTRVIEGASAK
ncbi:alpha/beta hydrolase domain-containing protein [Prosthecobacter sp.]|uniref:alpha/beta hydrolase domain-containing protein n=1 Tax=Prosthecobacter sp. TaxID=1965333 RepID=UPI002ABBD655|nr:alpha/beta hydrolase domain-containing protein [Prosthecobacter sp.]MDZ4404410.1 alpha/beta hydrolase domain-containing protein [Prosthecobacter sp.]